jgi:hypothetical protein
MACIHGRVENLPSSGFKALAEWIAQKKGARQLRAPIFAQTTPSTPFSWF